MIGQTIIRSCGIAWTLSRSGRGENGMDLKAIRTCLGDLPEIREHDDTGNSDDLMSVAAEFTKLLRKTGVHQMRQAQSMADEVRQLGQQIDESREAARRDRQRAVVAERQLETFFESLIALLDSIDGIADASSRTQAAAWSHELRRAVDVGLQSFERSGIQVVGVRNETFHPSLHEIRGPIPGSTSGSGGQLRVGRVYRRGYRLGARILRRASVVLEDV